MNTKRPLRVLFDCTLAVKGSSGIPQEARRLYKTFRENPALDVTGLVCPTRLEAARRRIRTDGERAVRLEDQALFFESLINEFRADSAESSPGRGRLGRLIRAASQAVAGIPSWRRLLFDARFPVPPLDTSEHWDVLWRNFFALGLSVDDLPLVRDGAFAACPLSHRIAHARTLWGLPSPRIDAQGFDVLFLQEPLALAPPPGTRLVIRHHDMIPLMRPDLVNNPRASIRIHNRSLTRLAGSAFFVCNTQATRRELVSVHPRAADQSAVIPCLVDGDFFPDKRPEAVARILADRQSDACGTTVDLEPHVCPPPYLLSVGSLEPRKNLVQLVEATLELASRIDDAPPLVLVGGADRGEARTLAAIRRGVETRRIIHVRGLSTEELRLLYSGALAYVSPSLAEGFNIPNLEALACGTKVLASDIPAHCETLGEAADYFNPYSLKSLLDALLALTQRAPQTERNEPAALAALARCSPASVSTAWDDLFADIAAERA